MTTFRTHVSYTADAITLRDTTDDINSRHAGAYKPLGFWYEVDGDWRRWCEGERYGPTLGYLHAVDLKDCNVRFVRNVEELDLLHNEFVHTPIHPTIQQMDWVKLAKDWDGLEIAPYLWQRRFQPMWYYGWDCASGVIWRPRNATVTYIEPYISPRRERPEYDSAEV